MTCLDLVLLVGDFKRDYKPILINLMLMNKKRYYSKEFKL